MVACLPGPSGRRPCHPSGFSCRDDQAVVDRQSVAPAQPEALGRQLVVEHTLGLHRHDVPVMSKLVPIAAPAAVDDRHVVAEMSDNKMTHAHVASRLPATKGMLA